LIWRFTLALIKINYGQIGKYSITWNLNLSSAQNTRYFFSKIAQPPCKNYFHFCVCPIHFLNRIHWIIYFILNLFPPVCISKYRDYNYNSFDLKKKPIQTSKKHLFRFRNRNSTKKPRKRSTLHVSKPFICHKQVWMDTIIKPMIFINTNYTFICTHSTPLLSFGFAECSSVLHDLRNDMIFEDSDSNDDEDSWNFKRRIYM
jgi:hypothetical protein